MTQVVPAPMGLNADSGSGYARVVPGPATSLNADSASGYAAVVVSRGAIGLNADSRSGY